LGAVLLAWRELTQPSLGPSPRSSKVARLRLARRLGGSLILLAVAGQIWTGQLPQEHAAPEQAVAMLQHWVWVFALVSLLVLFALWDTWEGVRHLRGYLDSVEKDELTKIRTHLDNHPAGQALLQDLE
jgi:hypothetical protein